MFQVYAVGNLFSFALQEVTTLSCLVILGKYDNPCVKICSAFVAHQICSINSDDKIKIFFQISSTQLIYETSLFFLDAFIVLLNDRGQELRINFCLLMFWE